MADRRLSRANAAKALERFAELIARDLEDDVLRDAALLRFQVALEAISHAATHALADAHGLTAPSPRSAVRECRRVDWIDQDTASVLLSAVDDRNRLAHTYDVQRATSIAEGLASYAAAMSRWLSALPED
jgi:uncharacterized protein YutE (UPF0331/DUF86 family)